MSLQNKLRKKKLLYPSEVFALIAQTRSPKEKSKILKDNFDQAMAEILYVAFNKDYEWFIDDIPPYCPSEKFTNIAHAPCNMRTASKLFPLFKKSHKAPYGKKSAKLMNHLEAMHEDEEKILVSLIKGTFKVPGLTKKLIRDTLGEEMAGKILGTNTKKG